MGHWMMWLPAPLRGQPHRPARRQPHRMWRRGRDDVQRTGKKCYLSGLGLKNTASNREPPTSRFDLDGCRQTGHQTDAMRDFRDRKHK